MKGDVPVGATCRSVASAFGVSASQVSRIVRRENWA